MKKSVLLLVFILLLGLNFLSAQQNNSDFEAAYSCLKTQIDSNDCNVASTQQTAFNLMAMSYDSKYLSKCKSALLDHKKDNCFGESSTSACDIKSTAIAIIALKRINENVDSYVQWLEDHKKLVTSLNWYLEIDSNNLTICDINGRKVTIQENKQLSGIDPTGLSKSYNNYWYKILDLNKNYTISCDNDFITTILYQKPSGTTIYVSTETHFGQALESTSEKVNSYCFATSGSCDYESSLWATLALQYAGKDFDQYVPYLAAMSDESSNRKYLPSAFLYMWYNSVDSYYSDLVGLMTQGKFWSVSGNKYYDTAIAMLALQNTNSEEYNSAKSYLLSQQDSGGCWSSYTAFLLFAASQKNPLQSTGIISTKSQCTDYGHFCVSAGDCLLNNTLDNFECPGLSSKCCQVRPLELSCSQKSGVVCKTSEQCSGNEVPASDTSSCCLDNCVAISTENECEKESYVCSDVCDTKTQQERKAFSCNSQTKVCCENIQSKSSSGISWWIIILLVILITLVILAIIFRDKLKLWWLQFTSKAKFTKPPVTPSRPGPGPSNLRPAPGRQLPPGTRPMQLPPTRRPAQLPSRSKPIELPKKEEDKDYEETMKKLREMSK